MRVMLCKALLIRVSNFMPLQHDHWGMKCILFFPPQLCQQCLGGSHGTDCQQQAFSAQDLCCLSQKANLPKVSASPHCVFPGIKTHELQSVFWGQRFPKGWLLGDFTFFSQGCKRPFLPTIFSPFSVMPSVFPQSLVWCSKKWRKLLKVWDHSIWCALVMYIIPIRYKLQEGTDCKPEEDLDQPYPLTCQIWTLLEFPKEGFMGRQGSWCINRISYCWCCLGASSPFLFLLVSSKPLGFLVCPKTNS